MTDLELERLMPAMVEASLAAGAVALNYFHGGGATENRKADGSPVTIADEQAEEVILERLAEAAPWLPVIAEEAMGRGERVTCGDVFALVDPLDGTREFVAGRADFTVNIAVVRGTHPILGVIYAPARGRIFATTARGKAAMSAVAATDIAGEAGSFGRLVWEPIAVHPFDDSGVRVAMSRSHGSAGEEAFLADLPIPVSGRLNVGSSLKFALLASGEADLYMRTGPTMEWDTAAGQALLEAAGGVVVGLDGRPFGYAKAEAGYRNPGFVALASPVLRDRLFARPG